ncbi:MAG TPA: elongation factor P [bacterium]|nr:elongation factor P [bacterium]HPR86802.1 elongation factor P [bacterium]
MATTADFKTGYVIELEGDLVSVVEFQHFKMGRGGAYVRTKLRSLRSGRVLEKTFRAGDKVEEADLERRPMQYLYREDDNLVLMDNETYEQLSVPAEMIGTNVGFLKESERVIVLLHRENPIGVEMPNFVELAVASTEPGVRGDTVSGATKKAVMETGGVVLVPLFIEEGERLKIDTRTGIYVERVR